jgi:hypothetical protein
MADLVTLVVPNGAEGAAFPSHGTTAFVPFRENVDDPASRWLIKVPPDVAGRLTQNGGFFPMDGVQVSVPRGFTLVHHMSDPNASTSLGTPDGQGNYVVPVSAVDELRSHGFIAVDGQPDPEELPDAAAHIEAVRANLELQSRLVIARQGHELVSQQLAESQGECQGLRTRITELEAQIRGLMAAAGAGRPAEREAPHEAEKAAPPAPPAAPAPAPATEKPADKPAEKAADAAKPEKAEKPAAKA